MKSIKYNISSLVILSIILLSGCRNNEHDKHNHEESIKEQNHEVGEHEELPENIVEMSDDQKTVAHIELGVIELRQVSNLIKTNGIVTLAPQNTATVSVPMGGVIKMSVLLPGNAVSKGQVLAIIENIEFVDLQQNYFEIKNKFDFAEAEYKRHSELFLDEVYSQENMEQVSSQYHSLKAQLKGIEQKLKVIGIDAVQLTEEKISAAVSLYSPISGYIKTSNVSIGKYVSPAEVLFEIENPDQLLLELTLFEKDANSVKAGQFAHFLINNEVHEHKAKIYQVGRSISADKTYKVYATIQQSCPNLLSGMFVTAHIEKSGNQVTAVPDEAIVSFDNKYYIFAFEKDKKEEGVPFTEYCFIEVIKGDSSDGYTEIKLPEEFDLKNKKIVIKGAYNLLSAKKNAGEMSCG
jgi:RND family efflux transporter MFP subunit